MGFLASLSSDDLAFLRTIFSHNLLLRPEELFIYGSDASLRKGTPLAVVMPETPKQVQGLLRWADKRSVPIYVRGRGTNLVGDCVPDPTGVVVSTSKMDHILEISEKDFVAVVEPGVTTSVLQAECEKKGLFYPPDPATVRASSIGGNVSTCAGGMRALKYGVTKDFVLGCELILPGGELVHLGGRTHKNVVGLDLSRVVAGSEGTLGFMSKIIMKLLPKPESSVSLMVGFSSYQSALGAVGTIFATGILPCALEYIGDGVIDVMAKLGAVPWPQEVRSILLIRLDGSKKGLPIELDRLYNAVKDLGIWSLKGETEEEEEALWEIRRRINPTMFSVAPDKIGDDITVPRGSLIRAIEESESYAKLYGAKLFHYGHVGDGNIHINIMYDSSVEGEYESAERTKDEINKAVILMGGTQSGEHGIGIVKDASIQLSQREIALMRAVKAAFDPNGIMNPGKGY